MIIYIHGFGGSGKGVKSSLFREYFKKSNRTFISPSLSYIPDLAIQTLEELIESYNEEIVLMGSSLGGYYAIYLAHKYNLKAVLINPSVYPYKSLKKVLGSAPSYYDDSSFTWLNSHVEALKKYEVVDTQDDKFMLLVQKGDETLDYQESVSKLPGSYAILEEGGSHSFENIESKVEIVSSFLEH